jgi:hypothetical protein
VLVICTAVIVVQCYLGNQCAEFHIAGWICWFSTIFHLESCIWPDVILLWSNRECISICVQSSDQVWWRPWKWLDKCMEKKAWAIHRCLNWKILTHWDQKGRDTWIRSGRPNSNFTYWCDVSHWLLETIWRLRTEIWWQKILPFHNDNKPSHTSLYTREFFTKANMTVIPHLPYSPYLALCNFSVVPIANTYILHNCRVWCRISGGAEHSHRTWLLGSI